MSEVELEEAPAGAYKVSLPTFEGPLDLLLHLCQKHELDILDIPIAFVTEKYLEYLAVMQLLDLDLASEYLVMAATLAHIKSKQLLPAPPPGQEDEASLEEEDPREALIRRLLEYQKYKQAAADLVARGIAGSDVFLRGVKLEEAVQTGLPPLANVPLFSLVEAFQGVLSRSKVRLTHDIVHERMTLTDRINELVDVLRAKKRVQFEELFEGQVTRFDLVITFLALLEMTKLRMTRLYQEHPDAPIYVEFAAQVSGDEDPLAALGGQAVLTSDAPQTEAPPPGEGEGEDAALETEHAELGGELDDEAALDELEALEDGALPDSALSAASLADIEALAAADLEAAVRIDTFDTEAPAPMPSGDTLPPAETPAAGTTTTLDTERPPAEGPDHDEDGTKTADRGMLDPDAVPESGGPAPRPPEDDREQT